MSDYPLDQVAPFFYPEQPEGPPRMFALIVPDEDDYRQIVGYGMVLPDGSAIATSWPHRLGGATYSSDSAEDCAAVRGAAVRWLASR